ncbi:redoxin domain-containing protein [Flavitalea sp. BT771]|uniref:redoxin domain-containing protein n=1 Tax=Flavitalea sp. BT771 TaxID=3063329 RepID=UPI0026E36EBC|nr:redoxin domain-containing protein [Flavitalea sp. BT771]MDO6430200.1 redoxin domain-containing protein [Flavitalea sp. BT771]MDV6219661.1 redoxin domain-containing protein [Flavitalea sp. BT771]
MSAIRKYILILLLGALWLPSHAQNDSVFNAGRLSAFWLTGMGSGPSTHLPASSAGKLRLFIFLSPECPLSQNYSGVLNQLYAAYAADLQMVGIIPGKTYRQAEVDSFIKKYKIAYPLFIDPLLDLSHYLKASVTPEAILLDTENQLVYKGAIDNWYKTLGKAGARATAHYLRDAIEASSRHQPPSIKRTTAVGCLINDF